MTGLHLAQYRIDAELGRGGMGIVYRATDTKLNRSVALKVLPAAALGSEDDRARFFREAQAAAQLHHPNIATVFGIDEAAPLTADGRPVEGQSEKRPFIAMEFIEGETLQARIAHGPMKLADVVAIGRQVADALKAAHTKEIVHRDIKSANVMLTKDGIAKVLDFGLAKTNQSTMLTRMGSTLGTVAYMSPEQARGQEVDGRSDLYSLGTMLYEMVTGRLPFAGDYEQAVVYGILNEDPEPVTALRTGVPLELEAVVMKLLRKEARLRYQSAADLIADLETLGLAASSTSRRSAATTAPPRQAAGPGAARPRVATTGAAAVAGAALMGLLWWLLSFGGPARSASHAVPHLLEVNVPVRGDILSVDLSSDGRIMVYATTSLSTENVFVRDIPSGRTRVLPGVIGAQIVEISPDNESVLITNQLTITRASLQRGGPLLIVDAEEASPRAAWGPDGWIVYEDTQSLWKAAIGTGEKRPLIERDTLAGEVDFDWPVLLPDGETVMATVEYEGGRSGIIFIDFETGARRGVLQGGGFRPQCMPTGHLVHVLGGGSGPGELVVEPFDPATLQSLGSYQSVASQVWPGTMTVSDSGTLVYRTGSRPDSFSGLAVTKLVIAELPGRYLELPFPPAIYTSLELSPDQTRVVTAIQDPVASTNQGNLSDVIVLDLESGQRVQLTTGWTGGSPTWHPSGDSIVYADYSRLQSGQSIVKVRAADGSGEPRTLFQLGGGVFDMDLSADGTRLVYATGSAMYGATVLEIRNLVTGTVTPLTDRRIASRRAPMFSPDDRLVAYEEDGQVFVQRSDGQGMPSNFSAGRAWTPVWDRGGNALFYFTGEAAALFRATLVTGLEGDVEMVLPLTFYRDTFDVFADGRRVVIPSPGLAAGQQGQTGVRFGADSTATLVFAVNWSEDLR